MQLTERRQHILTGLIALVLFTAATAIGIKGAFGAFQGGYEVFGRFEAAGQGLIEGSDVKIRGVDIGEVAGIELRDGEAVVRLRIGDAHEIPADSVATIRAKTLFGEKYVDIEPGSADGPVLGDGDELTNTVSAAELERVLADLYPLLQEVEVGELATILGELADGGRGLGETINRTLVNGEELAALFAENSHLTERFLTSLASVSEQLDASAADLLALADAGNAALPTLSAREDDIVALLQQAGRLSNDVADLMEANPGFISAVFEDGSRTLDLLDARRDQVVPLVVGLRQYLQSLAAIIRIDMGDGTLMAAVKGVLGGQVCDLTGCAGAGDGEIHPLPPDLGLGGAPPDPEDVKTSGEIPVVGPLLTELLETLLG